jgi:hypothetical protein
VKVKVDLLWFRWTQPHTNLHVVTELFGGTKFTHYYLQDLIEIFINTSLFIYQQSVHTICKPITFCISVFVYIIREFLSIFCNTSK